MTQVIEYNSLVGLMPKRPAAPLPRHPEFARSMQAWKARGGRTRMVTEALKVTPEQARRYMNGEAMPRPNKMKKLAALIGISPAELQYGAKIDARRTPGLVTVPVQEVTADEQRLLVMYRDMAPFAKEALRIRAAELLEEFGKATAKNPFGKHHS